MAWVDALACFLGQSLALGLVAWFVHLCVSASCMVYASLCGWLVCIACFGQALSGVCLSAACLVLHVHWVALHRACMFVCQHKLGVPLHGVSWCAFWRLHLLHCLMCA